LKEKKREIIKNKNDTKNKNKPKEIPSVEKI